MARQRCIFVVISALLVALGGGGSWYTLPQFPPVRARDPAVIPVSVGTVARRDLPIYLTGLGTVQASFTVNIRAQVDGKLELVLFVEGQQVRKGDVLAKINPSLYQAVLDQAKAGKMQDEANLISAGKDLTRAKTLALRSFETQQVVDQTQAKVDAFRASIKIDEAGIGCSFAVRPFRGVCDARVLCARKSQPLVCTVIRFFVRTRLSLRVLARGLAVWSG